MPHEAPSSDFLYDQVKARLLAGEMPRKERIDLQTLADRYRVSVTPIREMMFRLTGERLVEPFDFGGFQPKSPDASELQQLYAWNGQHLLAAAHLLPDPVMRQVLTPYAATLQADRADPVAVIERVSLAIGAATGNVEFVAHIANANDRLHRSRRAEALLFADLPRELRSIIKINGFDVRNNVRRRLTAYHRRRVEAAPQIAALVI